ncbi:MAG: MetQ/NlpA family ABC transporter substrate-binding protein [Helicobacter sp.]|nr:MetQ/NlpA family ABC transporter substrate-binding protein [Helicobacter sp.]
MKSLFKIVGIGVLCALVYAGCKSEVKESVLTVGASPVPHAEILEFVKPTLAKEGIDLKIIGYTDYITPNVALDDGSIDANYFQHIPYMNNQIKDRGYNIVSVGAVHVEPLLVFSSKLKSVNDIKQNGTIAIPNDPSNLARSLILFHNAGLIKLKDIKNLASTEKDIVENPKNIKFRPVEAALLPKLLKDADIVVVNGNYALQAGLTDPILVEGKDSPYANVVAVKKGNENDPRIKALVKALQSDAVRQFIKDKYKGLVVPAF